MWKALGFKTLLLFVVASVAASACKSASTGSGKPAAAWRSAKPADVMAQGLSSKPSESFKAVALQIQAGLTTEEQAHLAAIDFRYATEASLHGDPVWRKGVRLARTALDQNPGALAAIWQVLGPSTAYAKGNCNVVATGLAAAIQAAGTAAWHYSCVASIATGGTTAPFCLGGLLVSSAILLYQAGASCDSYADEPTCTPNQLCNGGCPVEGQQCCGGALCTATTVCLACPSTGDRCQPVGSTCCGANTICNASETCTGTGTAAVCQVPGGSSSGWPADGGATAKDAAGEEVAISSGDASTMKVADGSVSGESGAASDTTSVEDVGATVADGLGVGDASGSAGVPGTPCDVGIGKGYCEGDILHQCDWAGGKMIWHVFDCSSVKKSGSNENKSCEQGTDGSAGCW